MESKPPDRLFAPFIPLLPSPPPRLLLPGSAESVRPARRWARAFVGLHAPDISGERTGDVELVVSELVTNAVRYGTEPGDSVLVVLGIDTDRLRVEVHDPCRKLPRSRPKSVDRQGGGGS